MDFSESEELTMYRDSVRKFIDAHCPQENIPHWEHQDIVPRSILNGMAELGILGLTVPESYGGMGRQVLAMAVVMEELAARWSALCSLYNMSVGYGSLSIVSKGTEAQKARFLPELLNGKALFAYGLSEPNVGGDLAMVSTRAEQRNGTVVINGTKRWISGANMAEYMLTLVRTGPAEARHKNLSFLIIPTNAPGITIERTRCMGTHGVPTNDVTLEDVTIGEEMILGGEEGWNAGWRMLAGPALEIEKLVPTFMALGIATAALSEAWEYSQQRVQFGKRICAHQAVRHVLADAQTKLKACRMMAYSAAWKVENELPSATDTSMAKVFVSETAKEIVLNCQQYVMGAYGYAEGFQMERYVRDILAVPIYGGSTAIQRNNIANLMRLPRE